MRGTRKNKKGIKVWSLNLKQHIHGNVCVCVWIGGALVIIYIYTNTDLKTFCLLADEYTGFQYFFIAIVYAVCLSDGGKRSDL